MDTSTNCAGDPRAIEQLPTKQLGTTSPSDREFLYTMSPPSPALVASVREAGVLNPLIVSRAGKLIAGTRRLAAARAANLDTVPVKRAHDDRAAFVAAVWENLGQRTFTALETGELLLRLEGIAGHDEAELCRTILPALGLGSSRETLLKYRALTSLPVAVKELAARGDLRDNHLMLVVGAPEATARSLATLFNALKPSAGEARDIKRLLGDMARRENEPLEAAIARPGVRAIVDEDAPPRARVAQLRAFLRRATLPTLSRLEGEAHELATVGEGAGVRVKVPPELSRGSFESEIR